MEVNIIFSFRAMGREDGRECQIALRHAYQLMRPAMEGGGREGGREGGGNPGIRTVDG